jgi:hypothetical protein
MNQRDDNRGIHSFKSSFSMGFVSSFLLLLALISSAFSDCQYFTNHLTGNGPIRTSSCVIVLNAFFSDLASDALGGAILSNPQQQRTQFSAQHLLGAGYSRPALAVPVSSSAS